MRWIPRKHTYFVDFDVKIYGGFIGKEVELKERDWYNNRTVLSGDFNGDDTGSFVNNSENAYTVLHLEGLSSQAIISGFYIERGNGNFAGSGFSFHKRGAGLVTDDNGNSCIPSIEDCHFRYNTTADLGGAVYNHGTGGNASPTFRRCIFSDNYAGQHGGAMMNKGFGAGSASSPILYNCLFYDNESVLSGGAIYYDGGNSGESTANIINSTFTNDTAGGQGGALRLNDDSGNQNIISNSILWNNSAVSDGNDVFLSSSVTLTLSNSIYSSDGVKGGMVSTSNNNNTDPIFVNNNNNFRLQAGSPAIDEGNSTMATSMDLDGNSRIYGDDIDIGAYEYLICPSNNNIYVDQSASQLGDGGSWSDSHIDLTMALSQACDCHNKPTIHIAEGTYIPNRLMTGVPGGITDQRRDNTFLINKDIKMIGGYPAGGSSSPNHLINKTILSGDIFRNDIDNDSVFLNTEENSYHIMQMLDLSDSSAFSGIVWQAGNADGTNLRSAGGAILMNSTNFIFKPQFEDCTFQYNFSRINGGAIRVQSGFSMSALFKACLFYRNQSANSGGAFHQTSPGTTIFVNSIFSFNKSKFTGGALTNSGGNLKAINCVFFSNTSNLGSAIYTSKNTYVHNSVFWNNQLHDDFSINLGTNGMADIQFSLLEKYSESIPPNLSITEFNKFGIDPQFIDEENMDFRFLDSSPLANAGKNFPISSYQDDFANNPRIQAGTVDIGVFEGDSDNCLSQNNISPIFFPNLSTLSGVWKAKNKIVIAGTSITNANLKLHLDAPEVEFVEGCQYENILSSTIQITQGGCAQSN